MRKPFSQGETSFRIFKTDKARFHHSDYLFGFTVFEQQELNKTTRHRLSEREKVAPISLQKNDSSWVNLKPLGTMIFDILIGRSPCIEAKRSTSSPVTRYIVLLPF